MIRSVASRVGRDSNSGKYDLDDSDNECELVQTSRRMTMIQSDVFRQVLMYLSCVKSIRSLRISNKRVKNAIDSIVRDVSSHDGCVMCPMQSKVFPSVCSDSHEMIGIKTCFNC